MNEAASALTLMAPILATRGSRREAEADVTQAVLRWRCMGVGLAFLKGQFGTSVTWVGRDVSLHTKELSITPAINQAFLEDLPAEVVAVNGGNKVRRKELRSDYRRG